MLKKNEVVLASAPSDIYFFDIPDVQHVLPGLSPNFVLQMLPDDFDIPEDFEYRLRYLGQRPYAYSMMSAAEYLVRCARQLAPQSSENSEIFDSLLKDFDRLDRKRYNDFGRI